MSSDSFKNKVTYKLCITQTHTRMHTHACTHTHAHTHTHTHTRTHTHTHTHIYIYIYIRGAFSKVPAFFCKGIENCRRLLKIQYVIAIHLMR